MSNVLLAFRDNERDLEVLQQMRDEEGWDNWLPVAELSLLEIPEFAEFISKELSICELAVVEIMKLKLSGKSYFEELEDALNISRNPDSRDLVLEGRLRMERGLHHFEEGNFDSARDDFDWAEIRLKSVAKASRNHDLSLLNKAAFHQSIGEPFMALHTYSEIARDAGHANETIAISRLQAGRILINFGKEYDAIRNLFNAHMYGIKAGLIDLAVEAGAIFVEVAWPYQNESAERMIEQTMNAKPKSAGEIEPSIEIHPDDAEGIFKWCTAQVLRNYGGKDRPDIRAMLMLSRTCNQTALFENLLKSPMLVEDLQLAELCIEFAVEKEDWASRILEISSALAPSDEDQ